MDDSHRRWQVGFKRGNRVLLKRSALARQTEAKARTARAETLEKLVCQGRGRLIRHVAKRFPHRLPERRVFDVGDVVLPSNDRALPNTRPGLIDALKQCVELLRHPPSRFSSLWRYGNTLTAFQERKHLLALRTPAPHITRDAAQLLQGPLLILLHGQLALAQGLNDPPFGRAQRAIVNH